jgi:hypothetical protein
MVIPSHTNVIWSPVPDDADVDSARYDMVARWGAGELAASPNWPSSRRIPGCSVVFVCLLFEQTLVEPLSRYLTFGLLIILVTDDVHFGWPLISHSTIQDKVMSAYQLSVTLQ